MSDATLAEDITKTITYLQQHGWTQEYFCKFDGKCCLVGAVHRAVGDENRLSNVLELLRLEIGASSRRSRLDTIAEWNDAEGRTFSEVINLLKRARTTALSRIDT